MISSTRKVSSSPSSSSPRRTERNYGAGSEGHPFVEVIDTTNNVLVRDDSTENHQQQESPFEEKPQEARRQAIGGTSTFIPSAIEALTASGVYEQPAENETAKNRKVNVYDNNQSMVKEDEDNSYDNPYLKHLYEKNEIIEEVDEFV